MCEMDPEGECTGNVGQLGRCRECGRDRMEHRPRRTGGAGVARHPLSDEDYRRQRRKLERTFE